MSEESSSTRPMRGAPSVRGGNAWPSTRGLRSWLRNLRASRNGEATVRETLEELIEEHERRLEPIDAGERALITNILNLSGLTAYDVMVPRADIVAVEAGATLDELVARLTAESHSRLPVYRENLDDVVGIVHIKDVIAEMTQGGGFSLRRILRRVLFVAPTMRVLDLLLQMRVSRVHMALVVDEYGGIDGLITIEDLVEQIVGEIEDEHDQAEGLYVEQVADRVFIVNARCPIDELESSIGVVFGVEEDADIDTLGGLIFTVAGRVPTRGELVSHQPSGVEFEVLEADPRRIKRVRLTVPEAIGSDDG